MPGCKKSFRRRKPNDQRKEEVSRRVDPLAGGVRERDLPRRSVPEMPILQSKNGNKRRTAEIVADNVYFGDSKPGGEGGSTHSGSSYGGYSAPSAPPQPGYGGYSAPSGAPASDFAMLDDDDAQLPF